uniref:SFRICE_014280 n=1 Tax=Spodoptera frugiperda TaxID=7108 RepID=A0A2H1WPF2_SPOFR
MNHPTEPDKWRHLVNKIREYPVCEYAHSNVGNLMLVIDGYRYNLQKKRSDLMKQRWRCSCQHLRCKATAMTMNNRVVSQTGSHNHQTKSCQ